MKYKRKGKQKINGLEKLQFLFREYKSKHMYYTYYILLEGNKKKICSHFLQVSMDWPTPRPLNLIRSGVNLNFKVNRKKSL